MAFGSALSANIDSRDQRKARGAFFTPPELAQFIAEWAIRNPSDCVLEPACGEAEFLVAAHSRLLSLGASTESAHKSITGFEIHGATVAAARRRLKQDGAAATIRRGDFLDAKAKPAFDAVIGNPPYVRFQSLGDAYRDSFCAIEDATGVNISALSSLWMPFVLKSTLFLKRGGRLALVLPAELLTVNYAAPLRKFLMESFASVRLVTFEEPIFPEVQEDVLLLLADGFHKGSSLDISWQPCNDVYDLFSDRITLFRPTKHEARWSGIFASGDSLSALSDLLASGKFTTLSDWGRISLGAVTGNNAFFVISSAQAASQGLGKRDLMAVCPPGSKHLRRLSYTYEDYRLAQEGGSRVHLFYPGEKPSRAAKQYIERGAALNIPSSYKCRKRTPWWRVPVAAPPDAFITYMNAYGPSICLNEANVVLLNSCHGLYFAEGVDPEVRELLPLACLNSGTMLGAEICGRAYGGGMLKLEPKEAAMLPVPSPELVGSCSWELRMIRPYVDKALEKRDFGCAIDLVDAVLAAFSEDGEFAFTQMKSSAALIRLRRKKRSKVKRIER